jgi:hypothetical protein
VEYRPKANKAISFMLIKIYRIYIQKWDWQRRLREEEKKKRK